MLCLSRLPPSGAAQAVGLARRRGLSLVHFAGQWPPSEKREFEAHMRVIKDFVTAEEEQRLIQEIEPTLSRLPYESSHWDDVSPKT